MLGFELHENRNGHVTYLSELQDTLVMLNILETTEHVSANNNFIVKITVGYLNKMGKCVADHWHTSDQKCSDKHAIRGGRKNLIP